MEETIAEVDSSSSSPSLERGPKVPMPGETVAVRKPSVPQPGQPRVPSPTSTVNTLELIGSPVSNRPRVQQPRAESHLSPAVRNRLPKYENTPGPSAPEPTVAMPGTPSQGVKVGSEK